MDRDIALAPEPKNVHATSAKDELLAKIGREGARTVPGRPEHGGNCDIKNLSRGSKVYLPVHVKGMFFRHQRRCTMFFYLQIIAGAKFSVGDLHFSRK